MEDDTENLDMQTQCRNISESLQFLVILHMHIYIPGDVCASLKLKLTQTLALAYRRETYSKTAHF